MYVDVGENRDVLESLSLSFVSWYLDHLFVGDYELLSHVILTLDTQVSQKSTVCMEI